MTKLAPVQLRTASGRALHELLMTMDDHGGSTNASAAIFAIETEARHQTFRCLLQACQHRDTSGCIEALGPHTFAANKAGDCITCGQP